MNVDKTKIEVKTEIEINSIEFFSLNSDILMGYIQKIFLPSTKQHVQDSRHDPTSSSLMKAFYRHQIKANFWKHCLFSKQNFHLERKVYLEFPEEYREWSPPISVDSFKLVSFRWNSVMILCFRKQFIRLILKVCTNIFNSFISMFFFNLFHHFFCHLALRHYCFSFFCSKQTLPGQCLNQQSVSTNFGCLKIYHQTNKEKKMETVSIAVSPSASSPPPPPPPLPPPIVISHSSF